MRTAGINRNFWIVNLILLLLYGWTLTEETSIAIHRIEGQCTAVLPHRTSQIACPGLTGGNLGLYMSQSQGPAPADFGPLDWLARPSAWRAIQVRDLETETILAEISSSSLDGWSKIAGEWRPDGETALAAWKAPEGGAFRIETVLRRPAEDAGILLLDANGREGWAFITSGRDRRAGWWTWGDGRPKELLKGVPFQKPFLAQSQSILSRLLRAHQGALLLLGAGWLLAKVLEGLRGRFADGPPMPALIDEPSKLLRRRALVVAALLVFLATSAIAVVVLERIPHVQDSITYLFQAQTMASGRLWAPSPAIPAFFDQEFLLVKDGRWFGKYPPGFPAVLALGVLLKLPWIINPLLAAATIPLLYLLGKSIYGRATGALGGALALASPFFLIMSASLMAHPAELFWVTLFMLSYWRSLDQERGRTWIGLAALGLGMTLLTRQVTAVAIGFPYVVLSALARTKGRSPIRWRGCLVRSGQLLALFLPFIFLLLLYQWVVSGDPFQDPRLLYWEFDRPGFGSGHGMGYNAYDLVDVEGVTAVAQYTDPDQPVSGHTPARGIFNIQQNLQQLDSHLFGWPSIFTLAFVWLTVILRRPDVRDFLLLGIIGALFATYTTFWSSGIMYGPRYFYVALPALLILTARGMGAAGGWIGGKSGRWAMALLVAFFIGGNVFSYLPNTLEAYRGFNFVSRQSTEHVAHQISEKAILYVNIENSGAWWQYGEFFFGNTPWLDNMIIYARDLGDAENRELQALYPDYRAYRWRDGEVIRLNY